MGDGGQVVGILSLRDVLVLPREQWAGRTVRDRMHPREESLVVDAEMPLSEAIANLAHTDVRRALVSDHGDIHSLLSMTDAARMFEALAGEDLGYLGGRPQGRFASARSSPATAPTDGG